MDPNGFYAPFGPTTAITYLPLTNSNIYTRLNDGAVYPLQNIQPPLYVVNRVDTSNGIGGTYSSIYAYNGAKISAATGIMTRQAPRICRRKYQRSGSAT